ncbi:MAG: SusF/SusE family outer membrane protein [Muribaculaceae bacterium]|nr:SusF/SusE family outer membrane protein [Muribaculaceae bacterium]
MKKFALYSAAAILAFSFVACDDYEEPNPTPQTNPQEAILQTSEVSVASSVVSDPYVLEALNNGGLNIVLATVEAPTLPPAYSLAADVEITNNGFARTASVPATVVAVGDKYEVQITPDDLQGVYFNNISKGPKAKEVEMRFLLKTVVGEGKNVQQAYVGGPSNYYGPYTLTVQPFPSSFVIEQNYYLIGTACNWTMADAIKFNHSGADPYDDPVFTLKIDVSADEAAAGWWWKIVPESVFVTGNWGEGDYSQFGVEVNGSEDLEGILIGTGEPGAGCLKQDGQLLLTINMEEGTYAFTSAVDFLYTPGDANGWSQTASQLLSTSDYANYSGYAVLSPNGFKFSSAPDWDHVNYGAADEEGKLSVDGGAGNLSVAEKGLYWCTVNTANLTYTATLISTIGVIGDATPNGWDASTALTPDEDGLVWTGEIAFKGGEFKFRANDDWGVNLGGALSDLTQDGSNIASPGEGTYEVKLDLSSIPYTCTLTKK